MSKAFILLLLLLGILIFYSNAIVDAETYNVTLSSIDGVDTGIYESLYDSSVYGNYFVLSGYTSSSGGSTIYKGLLLGGYNDSITWAKRITNTDAIFGVLMINSTDTVFTGGYRNGNLINPFVALTKNDSIVWKTLIVNNRWSTCVGKQVIERNNYIYIAGTYPVGNMATEKPYLVKIHYSNGSVVWIKFYTETQGYSFDGFKDFTMDSQGNIILALYYYWNEEHLMLIKTNANGDPLWGFMLYAPYFMTSRVLTDDQDNIYVVGNVRNGSETYFNPSIIKVLPNGTIASIKAYKDSQVLYDFCTDAIMDGNSIILTGFSLNNFRYYSIYINITGNNIDYKVSPIDTTTSEARLILHETPFIYLKNEIVLNTGGTNNDWQYIAKPSSWSTRQLNTLTYPVTQLYQLNLISSIPTITFTTPNITIETLNLTQKTIYAITTQINASYSSSTGRIKLETQGNNLGVAGNQGNPLYIDPNTITSLTRVKLGNKDTNLYLISYNNLTMLMQGTPVVNKQSDKITISLQSTGKISIGGDRDAIEKIMVDGNTICETTSACNQLFNSNDNLITLTGQVFKIYPNLGPRAMPVEMTMDKLMLVHKVQDINYHFNNQLETLFNDSSTTGKTLEEKLYIVKKKDPLKYRELIIDAINDSNIPIIFQQLLDKGLITQTIMLPDNGREALRETLENIYGPALINYPDPEGRIYLLYLLYQ